jgi:hypothetical protein
MAENIENNGCSQRDSAEHEGYAKASRSSPNTIESYRTAMNKYLDFSCNELKIGLASYSFQHSSKELLEKYLERMETEGN